VKRIWRGVAAVTGKKRTEKDGSLNRKRERKENISERKKKREDRLPTKKSKKGPRDLEGKEQGSTLFRRFNTRGEANRDPSAGQRQRGGRTKSQPRKRGNQSKLIFEKRNSGINGEESDQSPIAGRKEKTVSDVEDSPDSKKSFVEEQRGEKRSERKGRVDLQWGLTETGKTKRGD